MRMLLLALVIVASVGSHAQEGSCATLTAKTPEVLRRFLEEQRSSRQSPCLTLVIKKLGQIHDVDAIPLLVGYLDYMDPKTAPLSNGGATVWPSYPAVSALFQIGKPAANELLSAIQAGRSAELRANSTKAYMYIYRDNLSLGIQALKSAELQATTEDERRRLSAARQELTNHCKARGEKEAEACRAAAAV